MVAFTEKLHAAARSQTVSFNQLHQCDHSRVKQVLYCQVEDQPVSRNELVKGYEYEKDRYVVVEDGELAQITPRSSRVMEVFGTGRREALHATLRSAAAHRPNLPRRGRIKPSTHILRRPRAAR
jgi:non-homologous end joining protein Ku